MGLFVGCCEWVLGSLGCLGVLGGFQGFEVGLCDMDKKYISRFFDFFFDFDFNHDFVQIESQIKKIVLLRKSFN